MAAPEFLLHATQGWARVYADSKALSTGVIFIHLAGLLLGGGVAITADLETLKAAREPEAVRADHLVFLRTVHGIAITGLTVIALSGAAMLLADLETFWTARAFWIKMGLVAVLLTNGLLIQRAERLAGAAPERGWARLKASAIASLVLWFAIVLAGTILANS
jgi:hypothetical protein